MIEYKGMKKFKFALLLGFLVLPLYTFGQTGTINELRAQVVKLQEQLLTLTRAQTTLNNTAGSSSNAPLTVLYPNGGETIYKNQPITFRWTSYALPSNTKIAIEFIPMEGQTREHYYYIGDYGPFHYFITSTTLFNTGSYSMSNLNSQSLPPGQYKLKVMTQPADGNGANILYDQSDNFFTIANTAPITLTAPNGGEVWQLGQGHSINWTPYNPGWVFDESINNYIYRPDLAVNPASTTVAYLERLVNGNFITVGKILESGKASIHWTGDLVGEFQEPILVQQSPSYFYYTYDPLPFKPTPGQYYVRIVNKITGASDRSNQPFTLASEDSIWANLKINGVDMNLYNTIIVPQGSANTDYTASWTSNSSERCSVYSQFISRPFGPDNPPSYPDELAFQIIQDLPANGSLSIRAFPFTNTQAGAQGVVFVQCPTSMEGSGIEGGAYDGATFYYVYNPYTPNTSSAGTMSGTGKVKVVSPNTKALVNWGAPYQINWTATADVETVSIALYKNSALYKWIARDLPAKITSYRWNPSKTITSAEVGGNFQIYLMGGKKNFTGVIEDKSDVPFTLMISTLTPVPVTTTIAPTPIQTTITPITTVTSPTITTTVTPLSISQPTPTPVPVTPISTITSSNPPNGAVEAGSATLSQSYIPIVLKMTNNAGVKLSDFAFQVTGGTSPVLYSVTPDQENSTDVGLIFRLADSSARFSGRYTPISPGQRILITHKPSNSSVCLGFLPGDVDGNGYALSADIGKLNAWVGTAEGAAQPLYTTDINRDGVFNASDVTKAGELLSAPNAVRSLPACPSPVSAVTNDTQVASVLSALSSILQSLRQVLAR